MEITDRELEVESEFLQSFRDEFKPPYLGSIQDWAHDNVTLPKAYNPSGQFDIKNGARYLEEPLNALRDVNVRQVNIMAPPRSGKTLVGELFLLFSIANNPSPALWIASSQSTMDKMGDLRMASLVSMSPPIKNLLDTTDRHSITKSKIKFSNGMTVTLGSAKIRDLSSVGYNLVIFDEVWIAAAEKPEMVDEAKARVIDFPKSHKLLFISQGGLRGDVWDREFIKNAEVYEWGWQCPECKKEQIYHWSFRRADGSLGGLNWNPKCKVDGEWKLDCVTNTAALECIHCKHQVSDTPENREALDKAGRYIKTQDGDATKKSFRWNAIAVKNISWGFLAKEYLYANELYYRHGDNTSQTIFEQKWLARPYGTITQAPIVKINIEDYDIDVAWPDERRKFLTVDYQKKSPHIWWLIRAWGLRGESRLIGYGSCNTWEELKGIQAKHKIWNNCVFVDSGFDTDTIYTTCTKAGEWVNVNPQYKRWVCWIATKGEGKFTYEHKVDGKTVYRPYSQEKHQYPNLGNDPSYKGGRKCPFYTFSNYQLKNILVHLRDGKGAKWIAKDIDSEYKEQMYSEVLVEEYRNGKPIREYQKRSDNARNELFDLEVLQILAASLSDLLVSTALEARMNAVEVKE